jgi:hypothetical protein
MVQPQPMIQSSGNLSPGHASPHSASSRWSRLDLSLITLVCLTGAVAALILLLIPLLFIPAEDSVILFQFSRNLAHTGAITYITHGPHAEGATDFLWMVLIAAGFKLHIDPYWFVSFLNVLSLFLLAVILLKIAARPIKPVAVLFIAGGFGLITQYSAAIQAFSTLPFACLLALLVFAFLQADDVLTPIAALLLCLFRPDGIVFSLPILTAALILRPGRPRRFLLCAACFILPGLLYFFWRWHYFGHFLPLPFLVKSDTPRLAHFLVPVSLQECLPWILAALPILAIVLYRRWRSPGNRPLVFCILVIPTLFYLAMRLDQNIGGRFFIYFPIGLALLIALNWNALAARRSWLLRLGLLAWLLLIFPLAFRDDHGAWGGQFTTRKAIALDLAQLPQGTLLTTEAGVVPYYSGWPSYDAWGLSTAAFAQHLIQPEDVTRLHPDILLIHTGEAPPHCTPDPGWYTPHAIRTWPNMDQNLIAGAQQLPYDLWIVPLGNLRLLNPHDPLDGDHECWFVRRDSPLRPAIEAILTRHNGLPDATYNARLAAAASAASATPAPARTRLIDRLKNLWHSWK